MFVPVFHVFLIISLCPQLSVKQFCCPKQIGYAWLQPFAYESPYYTWALSCQVLKHAGTEMVIKATGSMFHSLGPFKVAAKRRVPYLGSNRATDKGKVAFKISCSIDSQDQPARISRLRRIVEVFPFSLWQHHLAVAIMLESLTGPKLNAFHQILSSI